MSRSNNTGAALRVIVATRKVMVRVVFTLTV